MQEALLHAVRRWASFRGEAEFRTWLLRIVINVFRDRLRGSPAGVTSIDENPADVIDRAAPSPPQAAMAAELEQRIAWEVSRLPPRQREVLVLIVFEGLPAREVANIVGISEANVHSTLSAGRSRLRARLAPYLGSVEK